MDSAYRSIREMYVLEKLGKGSIIIAFIHWLVFVSYKSRNGLIFCGIFIKLYED